ncbi:MAG: hypothetical protein ABJN12_04610 [Shimia thalassica]
MTSEEYLPILDENGTTIGDPGVLFLSATMAKTVDDIRDTYNKALDQQGAYAATRLDKIFGKSMTARRYAAHVALELWRSHCVEKKVCSLEIARSRVAHNQHLQKTNGNRPASHSSLKVSERDKDLISKRIDEVRKGWRTYRRVSHYLAVIWFKPTLIESMVDSAADAETALGLAKSFQGFLTETLSHSKLDLIKVPEAISAIPLNALSTSEAFVKDPFPKKIVRYHK